MAKFTFLPPRKIFEGNSPSFTWNVLNDTSLLGTFYSDLIFVDFLILSLSSKIKCRFECNHERSLCTDAPSPNKKLGIIFPEGRGDKYTGYMSAIE